MTPLPPTTPSTTAQYDHLISILTSSSDPVLEIDILPSSFLPEILYSDDPPSLGIPKAALVPLFLLAHHRFFSYTSHPQPPDPTSRPQNEAEEQHARALDATTVLLLWDPNHLTAANFRKRHLSTYLQLAWPATALPPTSQVFEARTAVIEHELSFLESMLTSPLPKHTKSPTLWSCRLWLLTRFHTSRTRTRTSECDKGTVGGVEHQERWERELDIVMKAAERHPANYYAWNYLRDLFALISSVPCGDVDGEMGRDVRRALASQSMRVVHSWCLRHPRDVSGWSFLLFLLRAGDSVGGSRGGAEEAGEGEDAGTAKGVRGIGNEVEEMIEETRVFMTRFRWRGSSVDRFLKAVEEFELDQEERQVMMNVFSRNEL